MVFFSVKQRCNAGYVASCWPPCLMLLLRKPRPHWHCACPRLCKGFAHTSRLQRIASDNLPRLPRLRLKKSGQHKPNKHAMSRLPRLAPTVFNMYRDGNRAARRVWCAGQRIKFAPQNLVYATQPCNFTTKNSPAFP